MSTGPIFPYQGQSRAIQRKGLMRTSFYNFTVAEWKFRILRTNGGWNAKVLLHTRRWAFVQWPDGKRVKYPLKRSVEEYILHAYGGW
jgi:hypothetical protein